MKIHLINCHPNENLEPVEYDPFLKEYSVPTSNEMTYYSDTLSLGKSTSELSSSDEEGKIPWLRKRTRTLNDLSDYGDALMRFRKHAPTVPFPLIPGDIGKSFVTFSENATLAETFLQKESGEEPLVDSDAGNNSITSALLGDICNKCREITVIPIDAFPPLITANEYHDNVCKLRKSKSPFSPMSINLRNTLLNQLVKRLKSGIRESFKDKRYLYCSELISGAYFLRVIKNREEIEDQIGFLRKLRFVKVKTVTKQDMWMVRARAYGRTRLTELEVVDSSLVNNLHAQSFGPRWTVRQQSETNYATGQFIRK